MAACKLVLDGLFTTHEEERVWIGYDTFYQDGQDFGQEQWL
jgi:hypothetical protein